MKSILAATLISIALYGCKNREEQSSEVHFTSDTATHWTKKIPQRPKQLQMCAAIRGNGNYVFAHWGAMARILEHYGPIHAVAGGSSGSATAFLYESVYLNPAVWTCGQENRPCTTLETSQRMALLFKSMREFINTLGSRVDFGSALTVIPKVVSKFQKSQYFSALASGDVIKASRIAINILSSDEFKGIIDSNLITRLTRSKTNITQLQRELDEMGGALQSLNWSVDGTNMFLRRGLIDFNELAKRTGIAGDFYAGRNPNTLQKTKVFLDQCSTAAAGKEWKKSASVSFQSISAPQTCGTYFKDMLMTHLDEIFKNAEAPSRLSDPVGQTIPALISTSIFSSPAALNSMSHYNLLYQNRDIKSGYKPKTITTDWLQFGYWGAEKDLSLVALNKQKFQDFKTKRFYPIGPAMWGEPLRVSPQEPGLGSALCNYEKGSNTILGKWDSLSNLPESTQCHRYSLGGWSDLYPSQVLKNLGCEHVVYITRQDDEGQFIKDVAKLVTSNEREWTEFDREYFDLDNTQSSAAIGLSNMSASLCTDWNSIEAHQTECLQENAYQSPVQSRSEVFLRTNNTSHDAWLTREKFPKYDKAQSTPTIRGCLAGAQLDKNKRPNPCN